MWGTKKQKLITHDGAFHTDDIFSCAALTTYLEKDNQGFDIIRTRDRDIVAKGDFVFDVGGVYDPEKNRFDHHQPGGAGKRSNGVEYSSFGLIWQKFGRELCSSEKVWSIVDKDLVSPIDAGDNGQELFDVKGEVFPFLLQGAFSMLGRTWKEPPEKNDEYFLEAVDIAKKILLREIKWAEDAVEAEAKVLESYQNSKDKRIVVLEKDYPFQLTLQNFTEPLFVISQRALDRFWKVEAVRHGLKTFKNRKNFPVAWGGLRDEPLQSVSGVADAIFCHRGLYYAVAKSKEGAIALAERAISL